MMKQVNDNAITIAKALSNNSMLRFSLAIVVSALTIAFLVSKTYLGRFWCHYIDKGKLIFQDRSDFCSFE